MIIKGTSAGQTLRGTSVADTIDGLGGSDTIIAGAGNDVIDFTIDSSGNTVRGDAGTDTIVFHGAYDAMYGISQISGVETLKFIGSVDDYTTATIEYSIPTAATGIVNPALFTNVQGGDGSNFLTIHITGGMKGATGIRVGDLKFTNWTTPDTIYSYVVGDEFAVIANDANDYILYASESIATSGVKQLLLTGSGNDTIYGSAGGDFMHGGSGVNRLFGRGGNDTFQLRYTDVLSADSVYNGGAGTDFIRIRGNVTFKGSLVSIEGLFLRSGQYIKDDGTTGYSDFYPARFSINADRFANLPENFKVAGYGKLNITNAVNFSAAKFEFLNNADVSIKITGTSAANSLTGSSVDDHLVGLDGADRLIGGAGHDILSGGAGIDTLTGGTGADWFLFDAAPNSATNRDVITDMNTAQADSILFSSKVFKGFGHTGILRADEFYAAAGATNAHDASDRVIYNTTNGTVYYDADGLGGSAAIAIAQVQGAPVLQFGDFGVLI